MLNKPLSLVEAINARDSLAKLIYSNLFDWLVEKINNALVLKGSESEMKFIGVLDIFGFEIFQENAFEQLCINYANEKLQQHFTHYLIGAEQEMYKSEGISWEGIQYSDNKLCLELIEMKLGILSILDDTCRTPNASDMTFLEELSNKHNKHPHFEKPKKTKDTFVIKHFAGDVEYRVTLFASHFFFSLYQKKFGLIKKKR